MSIQLRGKTLRGKNKIRKHGDWWYIVQKVNNAQCLNNKPGMLIRSMQDDDLRWICQENDSDFDIIDTHSD